MLKAKKQFSQNFLVDKKAKSRVLGAMSQLCDYADPNYSLPIVEIGPGAGDLTEEILNWKRSVIALELDTEAVEYLNENLVRENLTLIQCDAMKVIERGELSFGSNPFLKWSKSETLGDSMISNGDSAVKSEGILRSAQEDSFIKCTQKDFTINTPFEGMEPQVLGLSELPNDFILLSALPYQVGSRILVDLAVRYPHVSFGCIHQREVVKKTIESEGFGFFGAWLKLFWKTEYKFDLAPHCFNPQPKVYSTFFTGKSKNLQSSQLFSTIKDRHNAKNILKKLFSFPSKTLANNLKTLDWTKEKIDSFLTVNFENPTNIRLNWQNYEMVLRKILEQN